MKLIILMSVFFTMLIYENCAEKIAECKTGNVTIAKKDELVGVFLSEYASKSNFAWNAFTGNWFSHLTRIGEYSLYDLCDCIASKSNVNKTDNIVYLAEVTTIEKAELDFSLINIKSSTPLVNCVVNNQDFYIMEGYRNNGLRSTMDIYVLKKIDIKVPAGKYLVRFSASIQSVVIPSCKICLRI